MPQRKALPGRLMIRAEGEWWNAYFGETPTDAIHLGSIRMSIVSKSEDIKRQFLAVMTEVVAVAIADVFGERPTMEVQDAPEHERSGNA